MKKTKIAIFDLTGCNGCEFHLLSLNELLLDFFQDFEITNWRLLSEKERNDFDIAFIEGAVTKKEQVKLLKKIRKTSKIIVALGTCAISGNIFKLPQEKRRELASKIYSKNYKLKTDFFEPVENFIKIDEKIPGCPLNIELFKKILNKFKKTKNISRIKEITPPDFTAKIEGHGSLKINFKNKKVNFEAEEGERLIEGLLLGKDFKQAPFITSRICGLCPTAHHLCSISAIENAFQIKPSEEVIILRKILLSAQIIKSHLLHLFFLVLPDFAGLKGGIELSKKYPAEFHLMLNLKRVADNILETISGSATFPSNPIINGFNNFPSKEKLLAIRDSIFEVIDEAQDLIKLFASFEIPKIKVQTKLVTIQPLEKNSYPFYPGKFSEKIKEIVELDSPAKLGILENGQIIKVGALSRMFCFSNFLQKRAKKIFKELQLDLQNPFNNNLAQAIEILHFLEEVIFLINKISNLPVLPIDKQSDKTILSVAGKTDQIYFAGQACIEAPRGTLFHRIKIDSQGKIVEYNIIPPTQINLASLKKEAEELIKKEKKLSNQEQTRKIEKLIRAFDPCITCAVH